MLEAKKRGALVRASLRDEAGAVRATELAKARDEAKKILDAGGAELEADLQKVRGDLEGQASAFATQMIDRILGQKGAA